MDKINVSDQADEVDQSGEVALNQLDSLHREQQERIELKKILRIWSGALNIKMVGEQEQVLNGSY